MVATKSLKPGDLILKEWPLAYAPGSLVENVCFSCHKIFTKPLICSDCTSPLCNKTCQMSTEHQKECVLLRRITNEELEDQVPFKRAIFLLPLRCLLLRNEAPEKWKNFIQLEPHLDIRRQTPTWSFVERRLVPHLKKMLHDQLADATLGYNRFDEWSAIFFYHRKLLCNFLIIDVSRQPFGWRVHFWKSFYYLLKANLFFVLFFFLFPVVVVLVQSSVELKVAYFVAFDY